MLKLSHIEQTALDQGIPHVWKINHVQMHIGSKHNISLTDDQAAVVLVKAASVARGGAIVWEDIAKAYDLIKDRFKKTDKPILTAYAEVAIEVTCPHKPCTHYWTLETRYAGKETDCPNCGSKVKITLR